ncbi:MAG: diguanylate cyclase [Betaproteobacteria bacterium]|nr:diguanylate cyclase [Betaproteobacteria bacterium]
MIDNLDNAKIEAVRAAGNLPSPKGVALTLMQLAEKENITNQEIARVIKSDPALAGRILRAANSVHAGGRRPVVSVNDALVVLGFAVVRQLALGFSLIASYSSGKCAGFDYHAFWSQSLLSGLAVRALGARSRVIAVEEGFIVGLLLRVGELALATLYPVEYARVLSDAGPSRVDLIRGEQRGFAMDHQELTRALLQDWGLPPALVEPAYFHEFPERARFESGSRADLLTHLLSAGRLLAEVALADNTHRQTLLPRLTELTTRFGQDSASIAELIDALGKEWGEWGAILQVATPPIAPFQAVAATAAGPAAKPVPASGEALRILVVDDDAAIRLMVASTLANWGHTVYSASSGEEALRLAVEMSPQMVLVDWVMPGLDGIGFCKALRATRLGRTIYVLMLTSMEDDERVMEAFEAGVDDFLAKPVNLRMLRARLSAGQRVIALQAEVARDQDEIRRFAAELAVSNRRLKDAALTDSLTGLPNRRYALDRLAQEWAGTARLARPLAVMMIDIDHFKSVNDSHGHEAGDQVLAWVGETLKQTARASDIVCRLGGEEFLLIAPGADEESARVCAERLRVAVAAGVPLPEIQPLKITVSVGVACRMPGVADIAGLIRLADQALYQAKAGGRNRVVTVLPEGFEKKPDGSLKFSTTPPLNR